MNSHTVPDDEEVMALEAFVQPFSLPASCKTLEERAHEFSMPVLILWETVKGWACELSHEERTALATSARNFEISQHNDMVTKKRQFGLLVDFISSASAKPSEWENRTCKEIWAQGQTGSIRSWEDLMATTGRVKVIMFYKIRHAEDANFDRKLSQ